MDDLLRQFGELVSHIAQDLENKGCFPNRQELGEGYQTFLADVLGGRLAKAKLPNALYRLTNIVDELTKRRPIVLIDDYDTPISYAVQNGYFPVVCP
jgi:hypothetical protein